MEDRTELPQDVALLLSRLQAGLAARGDLVGVYVYGSLATGDYSAACSDIDVIVMVEREPDKAALRELADLHKALLTSSSSAAERLNCLYVPVEAGPDPNRLHNYWFGNRMTQWQLKVMTQAELVSAGGALYGPWPPPGIALVPVEAIQAAVYEEITGYWRRIAGGRGSGCRTPGSTMHLPSFRAPRKSWQRGDLITKSEAISQFTTSASPRISRRRSATGGTVSQ